MVQNYKPKRGGRNYNTFSEENMEKAVRAVKAKEMSLGKAAKKFRQAFGQRVDVHSRAVNIILRAGFII